MNKTLLLIMCDFLLLNLLALTHWEKAEPPRAPLESGAARAAANAPSVNADLVQLMKISLADEQAARARLAARLASTTESLADREKNLAALQQQQGRLETSLAATRSSARELEQRYTASTQEATLTKEQLARMQRELEQRKAEAERQRAELAGMERQNAEARQRIENLNVAVRVAEQEKQMIAQNLTEARQQVEAERTERVRIQDQTTQLAQGVGALAAKSGELSQEIRDNRPVNPNLIFADFLTNRVGAKLAVRRPGLFSPSVRDQATQTVLVSDGARVYAIMHLSDTPFALGEVPADYDRISGALTRGPASAPVTELDFLQLDPRVIVAPVSAAQVAALGAKVYRLAREPFKFPDAVLVRADDGRYGETPFRIDPANASYVKLDNRIATRLFGEFSPKRGDLVFSKTGELIGLMVNRDYCAVLGNFTPAYTLKTGDNPDPKTSVVLGEAFTRLQRLPFRLQ